jgi:hypothetical protein
MYVRADVWTCVSVALQHLHGFYWCSSLNNLSITGRCPVNVDILASKMGALQMGSTTLIKFSNTWRQSLWMQLRRLRPQRHQMRAMYARRHFTSCRARQWDHLRGLPYTCTYTDYQSVHFYLHYSKYIILVFPSELSLYHNLLQVPSCDAYIQFSDL